MKFAKAMLRHFCVFKATAVVTYKEWAAYRSHMMISLFIGPVYLLTQIFVWKTLYSDRILINGINLQDMIKYFGLITLTNYLIMDFAGWNLQMLVRTGKFTTFVMRPVHHPFFALSQKIGHRFLGLIFESLPVYFIIRYLLGIKMSSNYTSWGVISLILGFFMMFYINYSVGITSFWITHTGSLRGAVALMQLVFSGSFIPLAFFPENFQKILLVLPFQYTTYVPVSVFLGNYQLGGISVGIPQIVIIQGIAVVLVAVFAEVLYKFGLKRFSGVGV